MKNLFYYLLIFLTSITLSCSSENFDDSTPEGGENPTTGETDPDPDPTPDTPGNTATTPCDFDLSGMVANETKVIDCVLDLEGKTVNLPAGVTLEFDKGDIINGTLNFSSGGKIAGELLNSKLNIEGDAQLIEPKFKMFASRWDIVEGTVTQDVAEKNRVAIRKVVDLTFGLGATTFEIDKIDAYFYSSSLLEYVFELPSNFNLVMTDNTHLRAFLNAKYTTFLMILNAENVKVTGGNLYGFRNTPGYDNSIVHYLIKIKTGINVTVENVRMTMAAEDAMSVEAYRNAFDPLYIPSSNVLIKGCTFDSSKRNNLAIVDGEDIVVEDCTFLNAGVDLEHSNGTAPRYGIDIEPVGQFSDNPLQKVNRVIIRNNTERGSAAGAIVAADGDDILITGNSFEEVVSYTGASNIRIIDNPSLEGGIAAGQIEPYARARNKNTIISGNIIKNTSVGIAASNQDIQIFDNQILDCAVGIQLNSLKDSNVYNNIIKSRGQEGDGINAINYVDNVVIDNNEIDVDDKPFFFNAVNGKTEEQGYTFTFSNNTVLSGAIAIFQWSFGGNLINNNITNYGVRLDGVNSFTLDGNTIISNNFTGIQIGQDITNNLTLKNNTIECLNNDRPGHAIVAEGIQANDNKNMVITNNTSKTIKHYNGISIDGYDGVTVSDNKGTTENLGNIVYYRGNNSTFSNNRTLTGEIRNDIEGANNSVSN